MPKLPNTLKVILKHFSAHASQETLRGVRFIQPVLGDDLTEIDSLKPGIMGARRLRLRRWNVVPFHRNPKKEKILFLTNSAHVHVLMEKDGEIDCATLNMDDAVRLPPGVAHAVFCYSSNGDGYADLLVITSNQEKDVQWPENIEELIKNKHL